MRTTSLTIGALACLAAVAVAPGAGERVRGGGGPSISWWTIDSGGGTSTGGSYALSGTIGQHDASASEALSGGPYTLTGGFWAVASPPPPSCPGDENEDGFVNFTDLNRVLGNFGNSGAAGLPGDDNEDGIVNFVDLNFVLGNFGNEC